MSKYILSIDQGTTSSRAIVFDEGRKIVSVAQREFTQFYPASGWVEHDADEIWQSVVETCREAVSKAAINPVDLSGLGITNQRETTLVWEADTGRPVHRAIVWQDRRTADLCSDLRKAGNEAMLHDKTGLLLDPYFSGTKLRYILDKVDPDRIRSNNGALLFGTVDCFLLWKLTQGRSHKSDATNAARTMLFNIHENQWDDDLCRMFNIPGNILPEVEDCAADFGVVGKAFLGAEIPVLGMAGDQQAALMGQACFQPGMMKSTYGTGCFAILNTGEVPVSSNCRLLTTIGYRLDGKITYALEGSIFIAGAAVQWLRDGLGIIDDAARSSVLADQSDPTQDVVLVPAFSGLGAPYWKPDIRGAMFGLTRNSGPAEFSRAALESVCFQTRDLIEAIQHDYCFDIRQTGLRVDGGMVSSDWTMQALSNLLGCKIDRPKIYETTALGAAWLAASRVGMWPGPEEMGKTWRAETTFEPDMDDELREIKYRHWQTCVQAVMSQSDGHPH